MKNSHPRHSLPGCSITAVMLATGLIAFGPAATLAQTPAMAPAASKAPKTLQILSPEQVVPSRLLPPPFKDGSELQIADLKDVQRVYSSRTPERLAQAQWDDQHESVELFFATLGPQFDLRKLPATARMLATLDQEQSVATTLVKRYFLRNRPWVIDPKLVACDYAPNAPPLTSYPSGHATLGYAMGYVLAALMPEKAQAILARSKDYAYSRVVCGAHYTSDIEASHALGVELAMMMLENPTFAAQFDAAAAELKAARLTQGSARRVASR